MPTAGYNSITFPPLSLPVYLQYEARLTNLHHAATGSAFVAIFLGSKLVISASGGDSSLYRLLAG